MGNLMLKTGKLERAELYKDKNIQAFLSRVLSEEMRDLKPVFDPNFGYRYPVVEAVLGDASRVEDFLNRLYEAGILERKLHDRIIYCPRCGSQSVSTHYCCPYCKSFNIQKGSLTEHVKCGYMDVEENFRRGSKLVCPKCHEELKKPDVDYRKAGIWCTCKDCGKSFDIPVPRHFCRDCQANFTFEEIDIKDVYAYSLNEEVRGEISAGWIFITPIRDFLLENGFEVEAPAFLKGRSGAKHMFDIAAHQEGKKGVTVMDLAASTEDVVPEQPVIALFAKIYDVSPESAYLIAIPKLSENGNKMAELYNIKVIEGRDAKEITRALKEKMAIK
jgi:transcription elongation factor Elf1